jgi:hypothetical protein
MRFWAYYIIAKFRGMGRSCNVLPMARPSVSCGIRKLSEIKVMYDRHGWIPYCITKFGSSYAATGEENINVEM